MIYNDFCGLKLSSLGFGTMRLPTINNDVAKIDENAVKKMVDYAISNGVNYFDTAWGSHMGESENVMGRVLSTYPRDSYYLATKFPGYDVSNIGKNEKIFEKQLEKCKVDYFDFYLVHNVCEKNVNEYLDSSLGTVEYLISEKKRGRIKHLGFSTHADFNNFKRFLDKYGEYMEFCQIQLNYLDYEFQNAKAKIEYLNKLGIPVWVMEPIRGGRLANLNENELNDIKGIRDENHVALAFRFIQSFDSVKVVLSGMSDFTQVKENIETFNTYAPLSDEEFNKILALGRKMTGSVPCTSCRYCVEYCPMGLDIPKLISLYNEQVFSGGGFIVPMYLSTIDKSKHPSACIACGACISVCPQEIKIPEIFADFSKRLSK